MRSARLSQQRCGFTALERFTRLGPIWIQNLAASQRYVTAGYSAPSGGKRYIPYQYDVLAERFTDSPQMPHKGMLTVNIVKAFSAARYTV